MSWSNHVSTHTSERNTKTGYYKDPVTCYEWRFENEKKIGKILSGCRQFDCHVC